MIDTHYGARLVGVANRNANTLTVHVHSLGVRSTNWHDKMSVAHYATLLMLVLLSIQRTSKGSYSEQQMTKHVYTFTLPIIDTDILIQVS